MNSSLTLSIVTFVYGLAAVFYIFGWIFKNKTAGQMATWITILAWVGNTAGIIMRWVESYQLGFGHAPLSNLYESLVFFAWCIGLLYLLLERKIGNRTIGAFVTPLAFLTMAYASLSPNISDRIQPLVPALKSNWLIAHVVTCFIGYAAFAVAFGLAWMYLIKKRPLAENNLLMQRFPSITDLDRLNHQMVMFGFLFLSIGIITGAVWAHSAWGRYWGWDPKETWSLITWFIYATLLHVKLVRGWGGRRIAWLSIVGFGAVMFTYFGVNYLPGLHSYATVGG